MSGQGYEDFQQGDKAEDEPTTDQPQAATPPPNQAAPGPHPHEAADLHNAMGDVVRQADPMEGYRDDDETNPPGSVTTQ